MNDLSEPREERMISEPKNVSMIQLFICSHPSSPPELLPFTMTLQPPLRPQLRVSRLRPNVTTTKPTFELSGSLSKV
jgi:hypothetical protein